VSETVTKADVSRALMDIDGVMRQWRHRECADQTALEAVARILRRYLEVSADGRVQDPG
jgi:hypothetical protein